MKMLFQLDYRLVSVSTASPEINQKKTIRKPKSYEF